MPTYEYRCPAGHDFEKFYRKISDAVAIVACPECGVIAERQLSAGAGLLFRGSGFYITDYGKDGKGPKKEAAAGTEQATGDNAGREKPASEKSAGDSSVGAEARPSEAGKSESVKERGGKGAAGKAGGSDSASATGGSAGGSPKASGGKASGGKASGGKKKSDGH